MFSFKKVIEERGEKSSLCVISLRYDGISHSPSGLTKGGYTRLHCQDFWHEWHKISVLHMQNLITLGVLGKRMECRSSSH